MSCNELKYFCETEKLKFERVVVKNETSDELGKTSDADCLFDDLETDRKEILLDFRNVAVKSEPIDDNISWSGLQSFCEREKLKYERVVVKSKKSDALGKASDTDGSSSSFGDLEAYRKEISVGQHFNSDDLLNTKIETRLSHGSASQQTIEMQQQLACVVRQEDKHESSHDGSQKVSPEEHDDLAVECSMKEELDVVFGRKNEPISTIFKADTRQDENADADKCEDDALNKQSRSKRQECEFCEKRFHTLKRLNAHMRNHSGIKPFKCETCLKTFSSKANMNRHELIHLGIKPYECEICSNTFTQKSSLNTHKLIHAGIKPYSCEICSKTFSEKRSLNNHEQSHSSQPYKCDTCSRLFTRKRGLVAHERSHSGVKLYKCEKCLKTYTCKGSLKSHEKSHSSALPYKCQLCSKRFATKENVERHERIHAAVRPIMSNIFCIDQ